MSGYYSVFKDETKLDINYLPPRLPHRGVQLNLLNQFFKAVIQAPGKMSQRVLIVGKIGTGKTVLAQRFGVNIGREAERRGINLHYVHVNCRERRGSLFMILQSIILRFHPNFPKRGYSTEELLQALMQMLDEQNAYVILTLDELEALIINEGSEPLYKLSRLQESRMKKPQRLSLICILRDLSCLEKLDESTRSTLQRNVIYLESYSRAQLKNILRDRVELAFRRDVMLEDTIDLIAELAELEGGNARYAIELVWRAGKYADAQKLVLVTPECVRKAAVSIYPTISKEEIATLELHEKLFLLGLARRFQQTETAYLSMGEAQKAYELACEEFDEKPRGHTQLWKYARQLSMLGIIKTEVVGKGQRGRTTIIGLPYIPASELEKELTRMLFMERA